MVQGPANPPLSDCFIDFMIQTRELLQSMAINAVFFHSCTVSGMPITAVTLDSLRRAIAVVPQDSVLFHDSIFYNISYGDIEASAEKVVICLFY